MKVDVGSLHNVSFSGIGRASLEREPSIPYNRTVILAETRALAREIGKVAVTARDRTKFCIGLATGSCLDSRHSWFNRLLRGVPIEERHYWIGTLYTLMLPVKVRRSQATYFTPPSVADAVVDLAIDAGFDLATDRILDPAAGGAAFLSTIAGRMASAGLDTASCATRLSGIEIDAGLALLSRHLIRERLGAPIVGATISTGDALRVKISDEYGLVIANPPYGRVGRTEVTGDGWRKVAHSGHINKYALFTELCFKHARPGGIVALVIPSSFRAGPLYDRMRSFIRSQAEVLAVGSIAGRDGVFIDVAQDVSVLIARKGKPHNPAAPVKFPEVGPITQTFPAIEQQLPLEAAEAWPLPAIDPSSVGGATLSDYGVQVRSGYFVWNRERDRLVDKLGSGQCGYPLVWAKNVRPPEFCRPAGKKGLGTDFVTFTEESTAVITASAAAVMQRTTNDKQPRRLVVAMVDPAVISKWGGFVSENHTIVLTASDPKTLALAVRLLNTAAVDQRYRRVSGTAAVSVKLLRQLDLPSRAAFAAALTKNDDDAEAAAFAAYKCLAEVE
ncbi:class I SAM-dependent DNA methyltransferase [Leisingera sp. ANG59]|uniref:HsdM family class I SAM-dependent methyltransferase n=1 Tax=Leisingera sp. ANG59 TaxID=2675221 RepID=UPI001572019D|nr:N-6 DNA methylase [Leisingera sp. ANG59]NSY40129.1 N-6 DNA methylase [Leisingera sp. ANG59]